METFWPSITCTLSVRILVAYAFTTFTGFPATNASI
jgi:hypothetical protein